MSVWPPIIMLVWWGLFVVTHVSKHGEAREPYNGPAAFVNTCIGIGILYWGGFFKPFAP